MALCSAALSGPAGCSKTNDVKGGDTTTTTYNTTHPVSQVVGAQGGFVENKVVGGRVDLPPGALAQEVTIKISELEDTSPLPLPANLVPVSHVVAFEPHGQTFALDVKVSLTHTAGARKDVKLLRAEPNGAWNEVPYTELTSTLVVRATSVFSFYVAVVPAGAGPAGGAGGGGGAQGGTAGTGGAGEAGDGGAGSGAGGDAGAAGADGGSAGSGGDDAGQGGSAGTGGGSTTCGAFGATCCESEVPSERCPFNGGACDGGSCGCDSGFAMCGTTSGGMCANLSNDGENCGECGHSCFGAACLAGKCQATTFYEWAKGTESPYGADSVAIDDSCVYFSRRDTATSAIEILKRCFSPLGMAPVTLTKLSPLASGNYPEVRRLYAGAKSLYIWGAESALVGGASTGTAALRRMSFASGSVVDVAPQPQAPELGIGGSFLWASIQDSGAKHEFQRHSLDDDSVTTFKFSPLGSFATLSTGIVFVQNAPPKKPLVFMTYDGTMTTLLIDSPQSGVFGGIAQPGGEALLSYGNTFALLAADGKSVGTFAPSTGIAISGSNAPYQAQGRLQALPEGNAFVSSSFASGTTAAGSYFLRGSTREASLIATPPNVQLGTCIVSASGVAVCRRNTPESALVLWRL